MPKQEKNLKIQQKPEESPEAKPIAETEKEIPEKPVENKEEIPKAEGYEEESHVKETSEDLGNQEAQEKDPAITSNPPNEFDREEIKQLQPDEVDNQEVMQALDETIDKYGDAAKVYPQESKEVEGIHLPDFDPIAATIGPLDIRWYSLAYLIGILFGWFYISYLNRKYGGKVLSAKAVESFPMWMIISIIIGGRLGYVLFYNFDYYSNNLSDIYKVWKGGMSFHGGFLGVLFGCYLFSKVYKVRMLQVTDYLAAAAPVGIFLGRIANFINEELYGRPTDLPWGVVYQGEDFARHPSQLYEALMEGFILFFLILFVIKTFKILRYPGFASGLFAMFYGIFRIIAEFFRMPNPEVGFLFGTDWITMGQTLSFPLVIVGIFVIHKSVRSPVKENIKEKVE